MGFTPIEFFKGVGYGVSDTNGAAVLFERDGESWLPQTACVGPWSADLLHGGSVAALCVSLAEQLTDDDALITSRITLDLVRPVPRSPLEAVAEVLRAGRRVRLVEVSVRADGREVVHARVQRTAREKIALLEAELAEMKPTAPADQPEQYYGPGDYDPLKRAIPWVEATSEIRTAEKVGPFGRVATSAWVRIQAELVAGEPLSAAAAVCAACDFTHAFASPEPVDGLRLYYPNADLTVHLSREPVDAWVRMAPAAVWEASGVGHARCELSDRRGMIGTSAMTLVLAER